MPSQRRINGNDPLEWQTYTFVKVIVYDLPLRVRTFDIWRNLKQYGNIIKIQIFESRQGRSNHGAQIVFKPPPRKLELWQSFISLKFLCQDQSWTQIRMRLDNDQPKNDYVRSPVRPEITYDQEITLKAQSIDFGVLQREDSMTVMRSAKALSTREGGKLTDIVDVKFILNLKRMEIEVHFPTMLYSENSSQGKVREYRFAIALDDHFSICTTKNADGSLSYILGVLNPPWYSRLLIDKPQLSFVEDARLWLEDDMWVRQTDVVHEKEHFYMIDRTPVELRKNMNTINIARWTAFCVNFSTSGDEAQTQRIVENAMKDFNIHVSQLDDFKVEVASPGYQAPYWSLLKSSELAKNGSGFSGVYNFELSFPLRYQLEVCISQGWLCEYDIGEDFVKKLKELPESKAVVMLTHVDSFGERIFDPMDIFNDIKYGKPVKARRLPPNCINVHHATVTATGVKLYTPTVEVSNRVIRKYKQQHSHFLRVRFEDDDYKGRTKLFASSNKKMSLIFDRVRRTMRHGLDVAGRHYEFLAWGNSQLREHGCYFFAAAENGINAHKIRAELGMFDNEKIVAKRAARLGQCFSTTQAINLRLPPASKATCVPDISNGRYTFTDGVGKISPLAANLVAATLKIQGESPSCFQFRMGGCKGILVVDPALRGIDVKVRASQFKFESTSQELEIIRWSQFWQPFLNRQVIIVLSNLGVDTEVFLQKQQEAVQALEDAMVDDSAALKALRDNVDPNQMTLVVADLVNSGFRRVGEPFVKQILNLWRAWSLKYLKEKAKIPISKGCFVLGCVDETATLRGHFDNLQLPQHALREDKVKALPEVFVQITNPQTGEREVIEGVCVIARNPSLHLGDIRIVKAVNVAALHHLCDVLVMPQNGDRDLPSMCSGGDLDGDDYIVIWDEQLIPTIWNAEPFHYSPPPPKVAMGDITINHIIDFFYDYLQNDKLGRIAHAHLGAADFFDDGVENPQCLELVNLHSMAVDYPKTGVPAVLPRRLERTQWPHFMEKRGKPYHSHKVLGQLFDHVQRINFNEKIKTKFDDRILQAMETSRKVRAEMEEIKHEYDTAMRRIMARYQIKTEFEVWSTFVLDHSKAAPDFKFHEEIGQISRTLKEQYYQVIVDLAGGSAFEQLGVYAVAAYQITVAEFLDDEKPKTQPAVGNAHKVLISFPWLLADTLGKIASMATPQAKAEPDTIHTPEVQAGAEQVIAKDSEENKDISIELKQGPSVVDDSGIVKPTSVVPLRKDERTGKKTTTTTSKSGDPFLILNPFKGISMFKALATSKPKSKPALVPQQVKKRHESGSIGQSSGDSSEPRVSQASFNDCSHMSRIDRVVEDPTEKSSVGQGLSGEKSKGVGEKELSKQKLTSQFTGMMLGDGMMKDPADMTAEEMAVLGLGDDDDL